MLLQEIKNLKLKMHFQEIQEILNQKLTEIWTYRIYPTQEEILCDNTAKKIHFIQNKESQAVMLKKHIQPGEEFLQLNV